VAISESDFLYIRNLIHDSAAIVLEDGKAYLIESRLQPVARRHGFDSIPEMIAAMRAQPMNTLHRSVVEAMTIHETYFFRDVYPFELLKRNILPELINRRAAERRLNLWCGAASSGQEPYSVLMILREYFPRLSSWNINFIATDISKQMLERCREGRYSQAEVRRGLAAPLLVKYFRKIGTHWQIREELRRMIDFRELNLAQPWPALPPPDIVFLRNVLIYFNTETKRAVLRNIRKILKPDGYLFLGSAETTLGLDESFKRVAVEKSSYYQVDNVSPEAI
jgi:chemotaxis protein methyltransferase CheR